MEIISQYDINVLLKVPCIHVKYAAIHTHTIFYTHMTYASRATTEHYISTV